ncbi:hypothetical protein ACW9PK_07185 [Kocuria sp. MNB10]
MSMGASSDRERLAEERAKLVADLQRSSEAGEETARNRSSEIKRATRDVVVQALGTIFGGAVLAGLGQIVGLIPSDPGSITVIVILTVGLTIGLFSAVRSATKPPILRSDLETVEKIESIDAALKILDESNNRPNTTPAGEKQ